MSDFDRLKDKLKKLARKVTNPGAGLHRVVSGSQDELLRAILTEIDETILASLLSFQNKNGQAIVLEVANRRLLCVSDQTTEELLSATEKIAEQSISEEDDTAIADLKKLLTKFLSTSSSLKIGSVKLTRDVQPSEIGHSAENLAKHWSVSLLSRAATDPAKILDALLEKSTNAATAWLKLTDLEVSGSGGDPDAQAKLIDFATATPDGLDKPLIKPLVLPDVPRCVVLCTDAADGHAIVYASSGNDRLILALPADCAIKAATDWQRLQGR